MREAWVQELRNKFKVKAVKVHTENNLADMFTKCLATSVRRRLFYEIESIATQMTKHKVQAWASWSEVKWHKVSEVWFFIARQHKFAENLGGTYVTA